MNFLIVEDDASKKDAISGFISKLSLYQLDISCCDNVDDALLLLERYFYDFVILDLNLPYRSGSAPVDEGGITILDELIDDDAGKYKRPQRVFGISQHENLFDEYEKKFLDLSFSLTYYSPISSVWKEKLLNSISWTASANSVNYGDQRNSNSIVISVHGIRTDAKWQDKLGILIDGMGNTSYKTYKFGFFDTLSFLIPLVRKKQVNDFSEWIRKLLRDNSESDIYFVGHSFGTYLIGFFLKSLKKQDSLKIKKIILISSVLPSNFSWHKIFDAVEIGQVVNDCGTKDKVLLLSQSLVLGTGMSGRVGFHGIIDSKLINRYFSAGHDLYESVDKYFEKYCLPLFQIEESDEVLKINDNNRSYLTDFLNAFFNWLDSKVIYLISFFVFLIFIAKSII